jgi:hypothetical protein
MEINDSVTQSHSNKSFSFTKKCTAWNVLSCETINLLPSLPIANRIIRFIKAAINLWYENNMQNLPLDINLNAILIDSEARSCLFVFSMLGYSL